MKWWGWLLIVGAFLLILFLAGWLGWSLRKPPPPVTPVDNSALYHTIDSLKSRDVMWQNKFNESQSHISQLQQQYYALQKKYMAFTKLDVRAWIEQYSANN